jgi:hypothetical protein
VPAAAAYQGNQGLDEWRRVEVRASVAADRLAGCVVADDGRHLLWRIA